MAIIKPIKSKTLFVIWFSDRRITLLNTDNQVGIRLLFIVMHEIIL